MISGAGSDVGGGRGKILIVALAVSTSGGTVIFVGSQRRCGRDRSIGLRADRSMCGGGKFINQLRSTLLQQLGPTRESACLIEDKGVTYGPLWIGLLCDKSTGGFLEASLFVRLPMKGIIYTLGGQLDPRAATFAVDEQRSYDIRHGVVPQSLLPCLLGGRK